MTSGDYFKAYRPLGKFGQRRFRRRRCRHYPSLQRQRLVPYGQRNDANPYGHLGEFGQRRFRRGRIRYHPPLQRQRLVTHGRRNGSNPQWPLGEFGQRCLRRRQERQYYSLFRKHSIISTSDTKKVAGWRSRPSPNIFFRLHFRHSGPRPVIPSRRPSAGFEFKEEIIGHKKFFTGGLMNRQSNNAGLLLWLFTLITVLLVFGKPFPAVGGEWKWRNPIPQGNNLLGLWGSSGSDVFAVGNNGTILHYNGSAWSPMASGSTQALLAPGGVRAATSSPWEITALFFIITAAPGPP